MSHARRVNGFIVTAAVAAAMALAHLATITNYGIFRDEFYYLACGRRLVPAIVAHGMSNTLALTLIYFGLYPGV